MKNLKLQILSLNAEVLYEYNNFREFARSSEFKGLKVSIFKIINAMSTHDILSLNKESSPNKIDVTLYVVDEKGNFEPEYVKDFLMSYNEMTVSTPDCNYNTEAVNDKPINESMVNEELKVSTSELGGNDGGKYDSKGNSAHYQSNFMEYIREQERKYGTIAAYLACQTQVDRYNQRAGTKEGVPAEKDLTKRDWYKSVALFYLDKIKTIRTIATEDLKEEFTEEQISLAESYVFMPEELFDLISPELKLTKVLDDCTLTYVPLSQIQQKYSA